MLLPTERFLVPELVGALVLDSREEPVDDNLDEAELVVPTGETLMAELVRETVLETCEELEDAPADEA